MAVLANIKLTNAIEAEYAAFAPTKDSRVRDIFAKYPYFSSFLENFVDEFNQKRCTTALLLNASAPEEYKSSDAMASIRDNTIGGCYFESTGSPYSWRY